MQDIPTYNVSIHLGASALSMLITEASASQETEIEYLQQPIPLARDIFKHGSIKRATLERTVDILEGFLSTMLEYGLTTFDIKAAAVTNIIKEAGNHHVVINRLKIASGIEFFTLDNGGMTRLVYQKIRRRQAEASFTNTGKTLAIHVGPGNTRVLLLNEGKVERYTTYRLGTHRCAETLPSKQMNGEEYLQVIRAQSDSQINAIKYEYQGEQIDHMILIGYEIQLVARLIGADSDFSESIKKYDHFLQLCSQLNEEERSSRFNLDHHSEDGFLPALQINYNLLHSFQIKRYWIPSSEYERGLLKDLHICHLEGKEIEHEALHAARLLADKFQADKNHYEHVLKLATSLFHQTKDIHRLGEWELHLLQVAAIVHEIGGFISPRMHHKHSYYLISQSDIFGVNEETLKVIALIARYHRQSPPKQSHKEYTSLSSANQVLVGKLSALLRVADALDASQQQKIHDFKVIPKNDRLTLCIDTTSMLELEKLTLSQKGGLFEDLFGLDLRIEHLTNHSL